MAQLRTKIPAHVPFKTNTLAQDYIHPKESRGSFSNSHRDTMWLSCSPVISRRNPKCNKTREVEEG